MSYNEHEWVKCWLLDKEFSTKWQDGPNDGWLCQKCKCWSGRYEQPPTIDPVAFKSGMRLLCDDAIAAIVMES